MKIMGATKIMNILTGEDGTRHAEVTRAEFKHLESRGAAGWLCDEEGALFSTIIVYDGETESWVDAYFVPEGKPAAPLGQRKCGLD